MIIFNKPYQNRNNQDELANFSNKDEIIGDFAKSVKHFKCDALLLILKSSQIRSKFINWEREETIRIQKQNQHKLTEKERKNYPPIIRRFSLFREFKSYLQSLNPHKFSLKTATHRNCSLFMVLA